MNKHIRNLHSSRTKRAFACGLCDKVYCSTSSLNRHRKSKHVLHHQFQLVKSAHKYACQMYRAVFDPDKIESMDDVIIFVREELRKLCETLHVEQKRPFKVHLVLHVEMYKLNGEGKVEQVEVFPFRAFAIKMEHGKNHSFEIVRAMQHINNSIEQFLNQVSVEKNLFRLSFFCRWRRAVSLLSLLSSSSLLRSSLDGIFPFSLLFFRPPFSCSLSFRLFRE